MAESAKWYVVHTYSGYENKVRFPSLESIAKFCKFYNISLEKFFAGITYPEEPQE